MTATGYRDLYLFDRQGNLVYTTRKGDDFAMNFAEGAGDYAIVGARHAVPQDVRRRACPGSVEFADFSHYAAIPETPVAFFATPVETVLGARIGVIAVSITAERLSTIIGYRTGLGKTRRHDRRRGRRHRRARTHPRRRTTTCSSRRSSIRSSRKR